MLGKLQFTAFDSTTHTSEIFLLIQPVRYDELKRMSEEAEMACFKILLQHSLELFSKTMKVLCI